MRGVSPVESPTTVRRRGGGYDGTGSFVYNKTQEYLSSRGFGWLLEVDESANKRDSFEINSEDTLQQSILEELDIDVKDILWRVKKVIIPFGTEQTSQEDINRLRQPDFWGPFFVVLLYSLLILWGQMRVITWVFLIWIFGSALIWMLTNLLGENATVEYTPLPTDDMQDQHSPIDESTSVAYSQVVSYTGYSLLPEVFMVLIMFLLGMIPFMDDMPLSFASLILKTIAIAWSARSCTRLLIMDGSLQKKRNLILVPLVLLYMYFVTMQSGV